MEKSEELLQSIQIIWSSILRWTILKMLRILLAEVFVDVCSIKIIEI